MLSGGHLTVNDDQDPLPSEDVSVTDENFSHNSQQMPNEFITISVTNEHGEKIKGHLQNG